MAVTYKAYHTATLPNKDKVPVKDHGLMTGRDFSLSGDVTSAKVKFHGDENVELVAELADESVTLGKVNPSAVADDLDEVDPEDPRLASAGAVIEKINDMIPVVATDAQIDTLFD